MRQTKMYWALVRIALVVCLMASCNKEELQTVEPQPAALAETGPLGALVGHLGPEVSHKEPKSSKINQNLCVYIFLEIVERG